MSQNRYRLGYFDIFNVSIAKVSQIETIDFAVLFVELLVFKLYVCFVGVGLR